MNDDGVFQKSLRRRVAGAAAAALCNASREVPGDARRWRRRDAAFVRFVIDAPGGGTIGLFQSSDLLDADDGALPPAARSAVAGAYRWFNAHVPMPPRACRRPGVVFWFRADAREAIARMRTIIECYRLAGRPITMLTSRTPGRIVYRDAVQVGAISYGDQRPTTSAW